LNLPLPATKLDGDVSENSIQLTIMTQATDTDIRELKDLILGLDKKIDDTRADIRVMEAKIEGKMETIDSRLNAIEGKLTTLENRMLGLDNRLWGFGMLVLTSALTILGKVFLFPNP
jgi:chromosome segregation ATPase